MKMTLAYSKVHGKNTAGKVESSWRKKAIIIVTNSALVQET